MTTPRHPRPSTVDRDGTERYGDLDTLPIGALMCAAAGHSWDLIRDVADGPHSALEWRCDRCGRTKDERLDDAGDHVTSPAYAGGALLHKNIHAERRAAKLVLRRRLRDGEAVKRSRRTRSSTSSATLSAVTA